MITYEIIDKDTIKRITTKEEVFNVKTLEAELDSIKSKIALLKKEEPDEVLVTNENKYPVIEELERRIEEINLILK